MTVRWFQKKPRQESKAGGRIPFSLTLTHGVKTNRTGVIGYVFSEDFTGFANHYIQSDIYYRIRMQLVKEGLDLVPVFDEGNTVSFFHREEYQQSTV